LRARTVLLPPQRLNPGIPQKHCPMSDMPPLPVRARLERARC
jgi:hypothetical protein